MAEGMLFGNFKNYHILRYDIYEFLKRVWGGPWPTLLVRTFCAVFEGFELNQKSSPPFW